MLHNIQIVGEKIVSKEDRVFCIPANEFQIPILEAKKFHVLLRHYEKEIDGNWTDCPIVDCYFCNNDFTF